jgi:hypothetical protein
MLLSAVALYASSEMCCLPFLTLVLSCVISKLDGPFVHSKLKEA